MTTPASPLEPCPWCGSAPLESEGDIRCENREWFISCRTECAANPMTTSYSTKEEAIAAWNGGVLRERLRIALEGKCHESVCVSYEHKLEDAEHRAEAAEARVKELEDMLRWDNDARIAQESREIALDESALERGIREGFAAARTSTIGEYSYAFVEEFLDARRDAISKEAAKKDG